MMLSDYVALNEMLIGCNEMERMWKEKSWHNLRYYPGICLEGLRKTTKNLGQDYWSPGCGLNLGPPE
jgi:hypothetical protein